MIRLALECRAQVESWGQLSYLLPESVLHILCLVTDAFGGRGGIPQYNRDLLSALLATGAFSSITVLPRLNPDPPGAPDRRIKQAPAPPGRLAFVITTPPLAMA